MTAGRCARCGADESIFWYPYAFALVPIPDAATTRLPDCQRYMLCDKCQTEFIRFMTMKPSGHYITKEVEE